MTYQFRPSQQFWPEIIDVKASWPPTIIHGIAGANVDKFCIFFLFLSFLSFWSAASTRPWPATSHR